MYPQNSSTSEKYETLALRLICFIVRYCCVKRGKFHLEVHLTTEQRESARWMYEALLSQAERGDDQWDALVHKVLFSLLFTAHRQLLQESQKDPILIFLMLLNLSPNTGHFSSCGTMCGKMSGLLHIFRLVALKEISLAADGEVSVDDVAESTEFK
jgi:hypothetical protein